MTDRTGEEIEDAARDIHHIVKDHHFRTGGESLDTEDAHKLFAEISDLRTAAGLLYAWEQEWVCIRWLDGEAVWEAGPKEPRS
jgi:hypothetical protein